MLELYAQLNEIAKEIFQVNDFSASREGTEGSGFRLPSPAKLLILFRKKEAKEEKEVFLNSMGKKKYIFFLFLFITCI